MIEAGNCNPCAYGFLYDSRNQSPAAMFDASGARVTEAKGISTTGQIVGFFNSAPGTHGFLYDGHSFTQLDVPNSSSTQALGISSHGQYLDAGQKGFCAALDRAETLEYHGTYQPSWCIKMPGPNAIETSEKKPHLVTDGRDYVLLRVWGW